MNSYNGFSPDQRIRAQKWLVEQWNRGCVPRPSQCCACGQTAGIIHAHAEDYSEPFGPHIYEYPLCYRCHITLHCRHSNPAAWLRFIQYLREGWSWPPLYQNDFDAIKRFLQGGEVPPIRGPQRHHLVFDLMFSCRMKPQPGVSISKKEAAPTFVGAPAAQGPR